MATRPENITEEVWVTFTPEQQEALSVKKDSKGNIEVDYTETDAYKNASPEAKKRVDLLIAANNVDALSSLFSTISSGQAKNIEEAIAYNEQIDEAQEGIDKVADLTKLSGEASNTIGKISEASKGARQAEEKADKYTKSVLDTVMPNIKRSQALQSALGTAQYNAAAGLPTDVQGAINSQNQIAYANALNAARGGSNQDTGFQAANQALFGQALAQGRQQALMDMQYRQQADANLARLASEDQAINTTEYSADVNNAVQKMNFQQRMADRMLNERDSYDTARRNTLDTLPYKAGNAYSTVATMIARDKIKNPVTPNYTGATQGAGAGIGAGGVNRDYNKASNASRVGMLSGSAREGVYSPNYPTAEYIPEDGSTYTSVIPNNGMTNYNPPLNQSGNLQTAPISNPSGYPRVYRQVNSPWTDYSYGSAVNNSPYNHPNVIKNYVPSVMDFFPEDELFGRPINKI